MPLEDSTPRLCEPWRVGPVEIARTPRLRLRQFTVDDAPWVLSLLNSPGWLTAIGDRGVRTLPQAQAWVEQRLMGNYLRQGFGFWAVEWLASGVPVGLCGLVHRPGLEDPDVGYALLPSWEGRGIAREAAAASVRLGHERWQLPRVLAITSPDNQRSVRVLLDIGLHEIGVCTLPGETRPCRLFESLKT